MCPFSSVAPTISLGLYPLSNPLGSPGSGRPTSSGTPFLSGGLSFFSLTSPLVTLVACVQKNQTALIYFNISGKWRKVMG